MTDVEAVVRAFLASRSGLAGLVGEQVYASAELPAGYKPEHGPAVIFGVRGGDQDYSSRTLRLSLQFRCYGADERIVRAVDRALYDGLNDAQAPGIRSARLEVPAQVLTEPGTGWPFALSFYRVWAANPQE